MYTIVYRSMYYNRNFIYVFQIYLLNSFTTYLFNLINTHLMALIKFDIYHPEFFFTQIQMQCKFVLLYHKKILST